MSIPRVTLWQHLAARSNHRCQCTGQCGACHRSYRYGTSADPSEACAAKHNETIRPIRWHFGGVHFLTDDGSPLTPMAEWTGRAFTVELRVRRAPVAILMCQWCRRRFDRLHPTEPKPKRAPDGVQEKLL